MNFKKKIKSIKRNPTKEYHIVITILLFSLVVFFTSKMWLPDSDKIQSTAIGVTQRVSTRTELSLASWEYNPLSRFVEVIITVADSKNLIEVSSMLLQKLVIQKNFLLRLYSKKIQ